MEEQTETSEETQEETQEEDSSSPEQSLVEKANTAAERLEAANKIMSENLEKMEALKIQDALGGKSEAGKQPEKKKEMSNIDYIKEIIKGEFPNE